MKNLLLIILGFILGYGVYFLIVQAKWREENCEKVYYQRKTQVCIKRGVRPVFKGVQSYCKEYKDTLVLDWKYKCPKQQ